MKVAVLKHHEFSEWRAIAVPYDAELDLNKDGQRLWLRPYLGTDWHLLTFADVESEVR
jgi:hypothetical protein